MRQLNEQQLNAKIARFLHDRLIEHPELMDDSHSRLYKEANASVVSRVKEISRKITATKTKRHTLYQS